MAEKKTALEQLLILTDEARDEWKAELKALRVSLDLLNANAAILNMPEHRLVKADEVAAAPAKTVSVSNPRVGKKHGSPIMEAWLLRTLAPGKTFKQLKAAAIKDGVASANKTLTKALRAYKSKITETEGTKQPGAKGRAATVFVAK